MSPRTNGGAKGDGGSRVDKAVGWLQLLTLVIGVGYLVFAAGGRDERLKQAEADLAEVKGALKEIARLQLEHEVRLQGIERPAPQDTMMAPAQGG